MTTHVATKLKPIQVGDPCDKCPAQAQLAVLVGSSNGIPLGELQFCFHHGNEMDSKLMTSVTIIDMIDNRHAFVESEVRSTSPFLGDWLLQD